MTPKTGSLRYSFVERSKERLLSQKEDVVLGLDMEENTGRFSCFQGLKEGIGKSLNGLCLMVVKAWEFGRSDPRKIIFAAKMGLALTLIALFIFFGEPTIFFGEPFQDLAGHSVWAILTVVVVFEFSIGATLSKGFNRGVGTLSAGGLALGVAELCVLSGKLEETMIVISIFIAGFWTSFVKLYPTMKPYEYGFRVFLLTYCVVMVSGYGARQYIHTAVTRFLLIAFGAGVSLVINIGIYPIWAGEDLHNLVVKNFMGVANSLQVESRIASVGCVDGYLQCIEYERIPSKILTYQASDDPVYSGYRSAVESTSQEETLEGFACWEPPHGPYRMLKYPWKSFVKLSGALRHCAFMVMALHGCILAEIQASAERRQVFSDELQRVGSEAAKVLRVLGNKLNSMERLEPIDILLEVHEAAEELQKKIDKKSYLLINTESWEISNRPDNLRTGEDGIHLMDEDEALLGMKSYSETLLNLRSMNLSRSWDVRDTNNFVNQLREEASPVFEKQTSGPHHTLGFTSSARIEKQSRTYESASALSLATFASLLIEFVARLQNLVDSFEELSVKAKFKEPLDKPAVETVGFWTRLIRCLRFKS